MEKRRNVILYIGTSIDGYIAKDDGTLEWLESTEVEGDSDYNSLLKRIDGKKRVPRRQAVAAWGLQL
ncbi:hypothetical protein ACIQ57_10245 [Lysinibacillus xylanilyticus]|uniref:hypothetical protein n=1 Tax=Lysinibacillus xylanilyticus TaxID=582475 RepID=UPI0037FBF461